MQIIKCSIYANCRVLVAVLAAFLVLGCGGGGEQEPSTAAATSHAPSSAGAAAPARAALAAPKVPDATALMDWAERQYPQFFPGPRPNLVATPFVYRAYPNGNYLGLDGTTIYILGPVSGGALQRVGTTTDFACNVFPDSCVSSGPSSARGATLWTQPLGRQGYSCADCHGNAKSNFSRIWNASGASSSNGNPTVISQAIASNEGGLMFQFDSVSATDLADIAAYVNASRYGKTLQ